MGQTSLFRRHRPNPIPNHSANNESEDFLVHILSVCADAAIRESTPDTSTPNASIHHESNQRTEPAPNLRQAMARLLRALSPPTASPPLGPRSFFRLFRLDMPLDHQGQNPIDLPASGEVPVFIVCVQPGTHTANSNQWQLYFIGGRYSVNHPLIQMAQNSSIRDVELFTRAAALTSYEDLLWLGQLLGPAKRPTLTAVQAQQIPLVATGGGSCSICLESFSDEAVKRLQCRHEFHPACITQWLCCSANSCPICRAPALNCTVNK